MKAPPLRITTGHRAALLAVVVLWLAGCATPAMDYQSGVDFSRYETVEIGLDEARPRSIDETRAVDALRRQLPDEGLEVVQQDADLKAMIRFVPYTWYDAEEVFWGVGMDRTWGLGMSTPVIVDEHRTSRLELEFVDTREHQVVWRALSADGMEEYLSPAQRAEWVSRAISRMLERYPPAEAN